MAKFQLQYTTLDGSERRATYRADDAGCALGILLDEREDLDVRQPITVAPFGRLVAAPKPKPRAKASVKPRAARKGPKRRAPDYDPKTMAAPQTPEEVRGLLDFLKSEVG